MEKRIFIFSFAVCYALALTLVILEYTRQKRFDNAEQKFLRVTHLQSELLDEVLISYAAQGPEKFEVLNAGYVRDGTLALLESLDEESECLLNRMSRFCGRRRVKRLVACVIFREQLVRRLNDAEMPFLYRDYPLPWETSEPVIRAQVRRLRSAEDR